MSELKFNNSMPLSCYWYYPRERRTKKILKVMVLMAHPDDPTLQVGGLTLKLTKLGHKVKWISITNGNMGHQWRDPIELAALELKETKKAAAFLGAEYESLNINDGWVFPNREQTELVVRTIRKFDPDLLITHRPNDYHRDHRYTSQLVMDSSYMRIVPHYCPDIPISPSRKHPIIAYSYDHFKKPYLFEPNVLIDVTEEYNMKAKALAMHETQLFEWLPWTMNLENQVPEKYDEQARKEVVEMLVVWHYSGIISDYRKLWKKGFPNKKIIYAEGFELCEYGRQPSRDELKELFPSAYFPTKKEIKEVMK